MALELQGLFTTPAEIRAQRMAKIQEQQQSLAGLGGSMSGLLGQVAGMGGVAGQMIAEGVGQVAGLKTKEEAQAEEAQSVLGKIDPKDPQSYYDAADRLQTAGLTKAAFAMMQKGQELANTKFGQDIEQQKVSLSAGRLALDSWKANSLNDNDKARIAIARDRLNIDEQRYEDMDDRDRLRIANEVDRIALAEKADKRTEDKTARELQIDAVISDVSYVAGDDAATYYDAVAERLTFEGFGAEAAKYAKQAEDIRKGRKINQGADDYRTVKDFVNDQGKVGTVILKNGEQIGFYETQEDPAEMSTTAEKNLRDAIESSNQARGMSFKADQLVARLENLDDFGGGAALTAEEAYRDFAGLRDERSAVVTAAQDLINSNVLELLPPGAASDADVALVKAGAPPANAGKAELIKYARAVARTSRAAQKFGADRAAWISTYKNDAGFLQDQELKGMQFKIQNTPADVVEKAHRIIEQAPDTEKNDLIQRTINELGFYRPRMAQLKTELYNITKNEEYNQ